MTKGLKQTLISLADKFETSAFLEKDPSQFMHRYRTPEEQELAGFIAANLAFGRREQILSHVDFILKQADRPLHEWIAGGFWQNVFPDSNRSFYRMYSFHTMRLFFSALQSILQEYNSLGTCVSDALHKARDSTGFCGQKAPDGTPYLSPVIASLFPVECTLVPRTATTCAKRIQMFLRWMVRDNSPVDLGLWGFWYDKKNLLMPLDTHVMQEAAKLGMLPKTKSGKIPAPTFKTAIKLTAEMAAVFPSDPCKGDFALFGAGIQSSEAANGVSPRIK